MNANEIPNTNTKDFTLQGAEGGDKRGLVQKDGAFCFSSKVSFPSFYQYKSASLIPNVLNITKRINYGTYLNDGNQRDTC